MRQRIYSAGNVVIDIDRHQLSRPVNTRRENCGWMVIGMNAISVRIDEKMQYIGATKKEIIKTKKILSELGYRGMK